MSYGPPPPGNPGPPPGGGYGPPGGGYGAPGGTPPDNGLTWAIVAVFCCWPLAIPAIINATKVNDLWNRGDQAGAMQAQAQAKKFTKLAFILGSIAYVLSIGFYIVSTVLLVASTPTYY
ncbi:CD225/dispanin family protein [Nocardiopsis sp. NPDC006198]|uniref:CD225/dispanin family protein n=1 Tax=Streptomonospora nanhaiensis TaxID=1323731 RepID=A0ABY6YI75_9ACTN|nr:CD225/dispanin family protein [Streptomonospora nanhaiensis]WAE71967.1 CD225/dispanin family protein [Streptomonospora nanhaiensis]